jgi:hypothetical protein
MKKLKAFFYSFKNSLTRPDYYFDVLKAPFSFSLKYFAFLFFFLSFITALTASFFLYTKGQPYINKLKQNLPQIYPDELNLTIKNGSVSTNVNEPYFIPLSGDVFPQELTTSIDNQPIDNIAVIDTEAQPSDISKYQTFILLTKEHVAFKGSNNEIRIQSLEEISDFTLTKEKVNAGWEKVKPYFNWIIPGFIVLSLVFIPLFTIIGKFIYLVLFTVISFIIARLFKLKLTYAKILQLNFHAITLPTVIMALFQALGASLKIPFFQSIVLLIFNLIIITTLKEEKPKKLAKAKKKK